MNMRKFVLVIALALAGCAVPYTLVPPQRQPVGDVLSVEPGAAWNRVGSPEYDGKVEVWTLDGPVLNTLVFVLGVPDGEPVFRRRGAPGASANEEEKPPLFRHTMTGIEIQELIKDTVSRTLQTPMAEAGNLRPATLDGVPGFRFETRVVGRDEVERSGSAVFAVKDGKLYLVWFQGARLHYYQRHLPEYERVVASVRLAGK